MGVSACMERRVFVRMNIIRNMLKVIFAIFIFQLIFLGMFFLRMKGPSKNNSREIATGRVQ